MPGFGFSKSSVTELAQLLENIGGIDGLAAPSGSVMYRVGEIERHLHSYEIGFETAAVPNAEIHVADAIGDGAGAFQIDAGNDDWGAWVQVLGSSDTPFRSGSVKFDLHRIEIEAAEQNQTYFIQIAFGESGAIALAAEDYTETIVSPASNLIDSGPIEIQTRRIAVGTKAWVRCKCPGQNTATLDFYPLLHEYEG